MKKKVFVDGGAGTTGLRIVERLESREEIELIRLPEELRKDANARKQALNGADVVFLCLPDDAAREAVSLIDNPDVVVIDASTAHRTDPDWAYGFPELGERFEKGVQTSKRIANPGCHASGFIALVYPLIEAGILGKDALLTCYSITGYSGGGKSMIKDYESDGRAEWLDAPARYGNRQTHKHLKEMAGICALENAPLFCPVVADFYSGMLVSVPIFQKQLQGGATVEDIKAVYRKKYGGKIVAYAENPDESAPKDGFSSATAYAGLDGMQITVDGNGERILLTALYDNLGKGASGSAIECMNVALGFEKTKGLVLEK